MTSARPARSEARTEAHAEPRGGPRRPVVVLISGRGSNMRTLIEHSLERRSPYAVTRVFSDQPAAGGLGIARELGVPTEVCPPGDFPARDAFDAALAEAVARSAPALVVLAGFMRILGSAFVTRFSGRILNIHPSLLPKYPGLHTHRRVLAAGDCEHGATVHFVTPELDGGPLVLRGRVDPRTDDDEASLAKRVQTMEHRIYPLAVRWFCEDRLEQREGLAWLDGKPLHEPVELP